MTTTELFDIGEAVTIPLKVVERKFDERGNVKYRLKDEKSGKILDWFYTARDIIPAKKIVTKKKTTKKVEE